ncbi:Rap1a/Tai family immunity protein [Phenylobacterium sp.]|uniref:Rap1a/Tai family immunity protein n=1 Tax=Phenylobacterium sp. TaxID=1871053 RepID=UPI002FE3082B
MQCTVALFAVAFSQTSASNAAEVYVSSATSFQLAQSCKDSRSVLEVDFCSGYILGAMDQLSAARRICPMGEAITGRALAVVRKYIADHPEAWGQHPLKLVEDGLRFAFPCSKA